MIYYGELIMIRNVVKIFMTLFGNGILVAGIINEIDGIGRFAMIFFGLLFSIIGSFMSFKKKDK